MNGCCFSKPNCWGMLRVDPSSHNIVITKFGCVSTGYSLGCCFQFSQLDPMTMSPVQLECEWQKLGRLRMGSRNCRALHRFKPEKEVNSVLALAIPGEGKAGIWHIASVGTCGDLEWSKWRIGCTSPHLLCCYATVLDLILFARACTTSSPLRAGEAKIFGGTHWAASLPTETSHEKETIELLNCWSQKVIEGLSRCI